MIVGSLLKLTEAVLALDLDVVETVFERGTHIDTCRNFPVASGRNYAPYAQLASWSVYSYNTHCSGVP
jgi:hypothetical protein